MNKYCEIKKEHGHVTSCLRMTYVVDVRHLVCRQVLLLLFGGPTELRALRNTDRGARCRLGGGNRCC